MPIHVLSQDGQSIIGLQGGMVWFVHHIAILGRSEYFGSYGQVWYNPYSILRISMPFDGITGHPSAVQLHLQGPIMKEIYAILQFFAVKYLVNTCNFEENSIFCQHDASISSFHSLRCY